MPNKIIKELYRVIKELEYLKMQEKKQKLLDRKIDTRKKIQLGGLFVKAGFSRMHPEEAHILYGMLLDCQKALRIKPNLKDKWAKMGSQLLKGE